MSKPTPQTLTRQVDLDNDDEAGVLYARSYLVIRKWVGIIGVVLPTLLFVIDWLFLRADAVVRGSLSAYYHSPARDLFVAGLCVIGVLLMTYLAGQASTPQYWLSTVAGAAVIGVAFLPTTRPNLTDASPRCGQDSASLPGCAPVQNFLGEGTAATIHFASAGVFILTLAAICFVFAREAKRDQNDRRAWVHRASGVLILLAVAWVGIGGWLGVELFGITPLYVGEVVSVYAFGVSWFVQGRILFGRVSSTKPVRGAAAAPA